MWHYKQRGKTYLERPNSSGCIPEKLFRLLDGMREKESRSRSPSRTEGPHSPRLSPFFTRGQFTLHHGHYVEGTVMGV